MPSEWEAGLGRAQGGPRPTTWPFGFWSPCFRDWKDNVNVVHLSITKPLLVPGILAPGPCG